VRNERRTPGSARGIRKPPGFIPWGRRMPTLYPASPRVDYNLTELGRDALGSVATLATWPLSLRKDVQPPPRSEPLSAGSLI
jgi:hypothetical protein